MKKLERQKFIKLKLAKDKKVYVSELARILQVTDRTIRSDLKYLSEKRVCVLFHGGAKLIDVQYDVEFKETSLHTMLKGLKNSYQPKEPSIKTEENNTETDVYVLGSFNIDIVTEVDNLPKIGQTQRATSTHFYPGGKGANQASAAATLCDKVHLTIKVGQDEFSEKAKSYLSSTNITSLTLLEDNLTHTGSAIVLVSSQTGNNMITIDLGANETIKTEEILQDIDLIREAKVFLTQLENNFDATRFAIEQAYSSQTLVILDPAPYREEVKQILPFIDIITPNEIEAEEISGIKITDISTAKDAAKAIYQQGVNHVIITMAEKGSILYNHLGFHYTPAYKSAVIDTSGAGDAFTGSLAAYLAKGVNLKQAINYATAFSSLKIEKKGASNMPDKRLITYRMNREYIIE